MAMLIGMSPEYKGQTWDLNQPRVTIGRNSTNIIALEHSDVSGKHCVILTEQKHFTLQDRDSTNGTWVNGEQITEVKLHPRDVVRIGTLEFMFDCEDCEVEPDEEANAVKELPHFETSMGKTVAPSTFSSISPFNTRRNANALWTGIIIVLGALAILLLGWLLFAFFS